MKTSGSGASMKIKCVKCGHDSSRGNFVFPAGTYTTIVFGNYEVCSYCRQPLKEEQ